MKSVREILLALINQGFCSFWNETQAEARQLDLDVKGKTAPFRRQTKTPYNGLTKHLYLALVCTAAVLGVSGCSTSSLD